MVLMPTSSSAFLSRMALLARLIHCRRKHREVAAGLSDTKEASLALDIFNQMLLLPCCNLPLASQQVNFNPINSEP